MRNQRRWDGDLGTMNAIWTSAWYSRVCMRNLGYGLRTCIHVAEAHGLCTNLYRSELDIQGGCMGVWVHTAYCLL